MADNLAIVEFLALRSGHVFREPTEYSERTQAALRDAPERLEIIERAYGP